MSECVNLLSFCDQLENDCLCPPASPDMPEHIIRIGLVMTHTLDFYRDILRGVKAFAVERPGWVFTPIAPEKRALELARPLRCNGYLAHVFTRPLANALLSLR